MIRVIETFAGIGSQTKALKNIGVKHDVVGISEWDVSAIISYAAVHKGNEVANVNLPPDDDVLEYLKKFTFSNDGKNPIKDMKRLGRDKLRLLYKSHVATHNLGSIMQVATKDIPDFDLLTYSFPCQAISLQGKRGGLEKGSQTSSSLLWEIERVLSGLKDEGRLPKYLLMENVANLLSKKFKPFFDLWLGFLNDLGYETKYGILKASDFDCPQNRERAFAVSVLGGNDFVMPQGQLTKKSISDIIEKNVDKKYLLKHLEKKLPHKEGERKKSGIASTVLKDYTTFHSENVVYFIDGIAPTITANGAQSRIKIIDDNNDLRYLTPLEHWKLMGFTKDDFEKAQLAGVSEVMLKKQAGNSISVRVLEEIFKNMFMQVK